MDQRRILEEKREQYRSKFREENTKVKRTKYQQTLMQNYLIYNTYNDDIMKALHHRDNKDLFNIIEDLTTNSIYFSRISDSGILQIFIHLIKTNTVIEESEDEMKDENPSIFLMEDEETVQLVLGKILHILSKCVYDSTDGLKQLLSVAWRFLTSENMSQVKYMLTIINQILVYQPGFHETLINFGLAKQLAQFIQEQFPEQEVEDNPIFINTKQINENITPLNHLLVDLVYNHLLLLQKQQRKDYKLLKQKPIMQCLNSPQYDEFLKLAAFNISRNIHTKTSVEILSYLIQYIPAYANCITPETVQRLMVMMQGLSLELSQQNMAVVESILKLIDSISYYCSQQGLEMIYKSGILPVLDKLLYIEQKLNDPHQDSRITNITFIICNLFSASNDRMVKEMRSHAILDHIFGFIQPGNRLIKLSRVFDYYFRSLRPGESQLNIMDALLEAIAVLDLNNPESQILRETVSQMYIRSLDKHNIAEQEHIENKLESLGLGKLIDEI